ncbi:winged helix DNA-binding domain-containing protein [Microlunatus elymi]|uniref:Winged helix DNA-binding domain-containing protein n=1 Tax=Microlunatus elymi TaxID=2596828 RepID=A0A516PY60_9ACTN|nr:winged helix DNA-binding domain-containing protein [Microlunatus elymi]QDP96107.1 winged helix DNA-binding domain-containing protein [Microlunatus elymi]
MPISAERLARMALSRQFPAVRGRGRTAVLRLFDQLGPIQSQVPRAPFLTAASRLPGVRYETVRDAFVDHELLRTTNLRGTVHTSRPAIFGALDTTARESLSVTQRRALGLSDAGISTTQLRNEIEAFCRGDWRPRTDLTEHIRCWLAERGAVINPGTSSTMAANLIWGHSGLLRRPRDDHWEKRTDTFHRTAADVDPALAPHPVEASMITIVRTHLAAYGPATREDIAWWSGSRLTQIDQAVAALDHELARHTGPDGESLIDLADAPTTGRDPGLRLLPEFDGLLLGYAPSGRGRFVDQENLARIWARTNGLFAPTMLYRGKIIGRWRTMPGRPASATVIELHPFPGEEVPGEDVLAGPVADTAAALDLKITDVRIIAAE